MDGNILPVTDADRNILLFSIHIICKQYLTKAMIPYMLYTVNGHWERNDF